MSQFNLKNYLIENKLTSNSKRLSLLNENSYRNPYIDRLSDEDKEYVFDDIDKALYDGELSGPDGPNDTYFIDDVRGFLTMQTSILPFSEPRFGTKDYKDYLDAIDILADMYYTSRYE